nr:probable receptor-like protein kinase At5g18500 isoform X1 [Tanacetum cinerariifolium]
MTIELVHFKKNEVLNLLMDLLMSRPFKPPKRALSGLQNEKIDIYSYGILLLEAIIWRNPVNYDRPSEEKHLKILNFALVMIGEKNLVSNLVTVSLFFVHCVVSCIHNNDVRHHLVSELLENEDLLMKELQDGFQNQANRRIAERGNGHVSEDDVTSPG